MSMRVILVPVLGTEAEADAGGMRAACGLARRFDGRVIGLFVRPDPLEVMPYAGEGVSPGMIEQLIEVATREMDRRRDLAREQFEAGCAAAGIAIGEEGPAAATTAAQWLEVTGHRDEVVAARGRVADLLVFGGGERAADSEERVVLEAALLNSGRPVLLAPANWTQGIGHSVAIAWNGRVEAARAVALAMPLIEAAGAVHVLTATTRRTGFEVSEELAAYLRWHGATCERHEVKPQDQPVGAALLGAARNAGADLLVMGAYSRSRFAELIFGGVTQHVLGHADLPVLLAH